MNKKEEITNDHTKIKIMKEYSEYKHAIKL